ncbi:hypothetical protein J1605_011695 [Eschrichtius robustus]|uniref:Uncharacterized protein n=1 Tax=Eschrichtius robustus TaxID=9764 RepID=A0AB34GJK0_ESCRO|nr:hypothetical protein J1605_011695 [Eschrichtius robustus]
MVLTFYILLAIECPEQITFPLLGFEFHCLVPSRCIEAGAGGEVGDLGYSLWSWKLVMGHGESHEAKKMMKSESQMTSPLE